MPFFDKEQIDQAAYEDLYGGIGEISYKDFFVGKSNLPIRFQIWTIPPGGSEGEHSHEGAENLEEIYYVIEVTAEVQLPGGNKLISAGEAMLTGPNEPHGIINAGTDTLKLVVIYGKATGPHVPV